MLVYHQSCSLYAIMTDSGDITGKVVKEMTVPDLSNQEIIQALVSLEGKNEYRLPICSAIKQGGEPLYKKARRGEVVEAPIRKIKVYKAEFVEYKRPLIKVVFEVGSGTYIRSLVETLGEKLGTMATLMELRRTKVGEYKITEITETISN